MGRFVIRSVIVLIEAQHEVVDLRAAVEIARVSGEAQFKIPIGADDIMESAKLAC